MAASPASALELSWMQLHGMDGLDRSTKDRATLIRRSKASQKEMDLKGLPGFKSEKSVQTHIGNIFRDG